MMQELIARLETAMGPDRELDARIHAAHSWASRPDAVFHFLPECHGYQVTIGETYAVDEACGDYTASIDAALTLVPEHYSYELTQSAVDPPALSRCRLWDWRRAPTGFDPGNEWRAEGNRPLVINICIAALKLRAEMQQRAAA